jgi:hypothetical protein
VQALVAQNHVGQETPAKNSPGPLETPTVSSRRSTFMIADSVSSAYSIEDRLNTDPLAQLLFHEAVVEVAARAKGVLPECRERIEQAVQLLHAGEVQWLDGGSVQVQGPEQEDTVYGIQDTCPCPENTQTPRGWCMHRLAGAIAKRASALVQTRLETLSAPLPPESPLLTEGEDGEALNRSTIPAQYIQLIHGKPFVRYAGLLAMAHERGLQKLEATFVSVTDGMAVAQATASFVDGRRFVESGDATPENVHFGVRPHFARLALTRAKARALRDALNIGMCAVEELE